MGPDSVNTGQGKLWNTKWFSWKEILLSSEKVDVFENQEAEWISKQLCINYSVRDLVQTFAPIVREAPFWNVLVLYGNCPNSFRPLSVKQANVGKKVPQTILASLYTPRLMGNAHMETTHFEKGLPILLMQTSLGTRQLKMGMFNMQFNADNGLAWSIKSPKINNI